MRHLELFSGIGGFRMAMDLIQQDGLMQFQHIGFSEIDKNAIATYKANFNTIGEIELGDIVSFTSNRENIENLPNFDILTGGFPCQSFSMMGKKQGFQDERGQMFFRIMDIVSIKRPRYIILENVKNLYTHDKGQTFKKIINDLNIAGYNIKFDIFNTSDFKLPQIRNRVIIFASLEGWPQDFDFSRNTIIRHFRHNIGQRSVFTYETVLDILSKNVPDKYLLSEKIKPTLLSDGSANFKSKSEINQIIARPLTASMHKMHRACQDNYYSLDFIESDGRDNPSLYLSKEELANLPIRKLTPREALMLQGFPSDFAARAKMNNIADGALYKQAGNAVSVNTVYAIMDFLFKMVSFMSKNFFEPHKEHKIGYKKLSPADLGLGNSHQTHIGLYEGILDFLPNSDVDKMALLIYKDNCILAECFFDRIENPDGTFRSPKIKMGEIKKEHPPYL